MSLPSLCYNCRVHTKNILHISLIALLLAALTLSLVPARPALAQGSSAMELINAVNAFRSANGLEPYSVEGGLMSEAQSHSDYQASIRDCTHTRADGSSPGAHGIPAENIACGPDLSAEGAVYGQWTDSVHMATMLGPDTGQVGAGVAVVDGFVYYTLAVRQLTGEFVYRPPAAENASAGSSDNTSSQGVNAQDAPTQLPDSSDVTSTPNSDGSISHIIQYGETLIQIANLYNVPLTELIGINRLDPKQPQYFAGQSLLIRLAFTATPEMTATYTPRPPTRTPLPTKTPRPTRTATQPFTPRATSTATAVPLVEIPTLDDLGPGRPYLAYAFIAISALGLVVLLATSFNLRNRK